MATYTTNYNLTKPDTTDLIDIGVLNDNFDDIDTQMKTNADTAASAAETAVTDVDYTAGTLSQTIDGTTTTVFEADTTPTQDSTDLLTSGGAYTALAAKQDALTFDSTPTEDSTNPVTSGGVYDAVSDLNNQITAIMGDMATVESTSTASQNYSVGDYLIYNGLLYKVTVAIASGGTITPGTNCTATDVGTEMATLNTNLANWIKSKTGSASTTTNDSVSPFGAFGVVVYTDLGIPSGSTIISLQFKTSTTNPSSVHMVGSGIYIYSRFAATADLEVIYV